MLALDAQNELIASVCFAQFPALQGLSSRFALPEAFSAKNFVPPYVGAVNGVSGEPGVPNAIELSAQDIRNTGPGREGTECQQLVS